MDAPTIALWTSRTSTCGSPVSQVIERSASRRASFWTWSISFVSSASWIGTSGRFRSWVSVVVKSLTSSPAMPMTTWVGRKPAISSASWSATAQLSTTAAMSATVPDCMCDRPWRLRPTPRTVPCPVSSISNTSALANSVPMSSAVQAAGTPPSPRPHMRRRNDTQAASSAGPTPAGPAAGLTRSGAVGHRGPHGRDRVPEPLPSRALPLCHLGPAATAAIDAAHGALDERTGRDATRDEVVAHRDEQLRLVRVEPERDDAARQRPTEVLREALEGVDRLDVHRGSDERDARADVLCLCGEVARLGPAARRGPGLEAALRVPELL